MARKKDRESFFVEVSQYFPFKETSRIKRALIGMSYGFELENLVFKLNRELGESFKFTRNDMLKRKKRKKSEIMTSLDLTAHLLIYFHFSEK